MKFSDILPWYEDGIIQRTPVRFIITKNMTDKIVIFGQLCTLAMFIDDDDDEVGQNLVLSSWLFEHYYNT